ncbi:hypothetical protein PISMIDRAFT_387845 [Pisolithus microcarpus 441]|uniref:Unplaced genomic scaffold scaffold_3, whole genome shotgun sequence n=1 Tax=Pisolithus microcarpus 441 TaxID=765257 RepID=A0A0C9ZL96_9AGAM|nr:hypothetical protein PISMIDRAFT_387845 [Pisolithus microcarpus 441]
MDVPVKRKVTAKLDHNAYARVRPLSRPGSPTKQLSPPFLPKAKVNGGRDTLRKLSSSGSLNVAKSYDVSSRPGSPFKSLRPSPNGSTSPVTHLKHPSSPRPGKKSASAHTTNQGTPESRQRSLTSASPNFGMPPSDDRPRSGSVPSPKFPPSGQASPVSDRSILDNHQLTTALPPTKIKSKISNLAKLTNSNDVSSSSSPSPWTTTRPVTRARAPSITSSMSLCTPGSSPPTNTTFYPITTAAPAANPYRYGVPRPVQSPVRNHQVSAPTQDTPPKRLPPFPKVDPASIPLPPHSPPISALSLSSKSSVSHVSETSVSLEGNASITTVGSHGRARSVDWRGAASPFAAHANIVPGTAVSDRKHESDVESADDSERHLRAEAKTNRKIADLEITNRSLLAINASLETTKNRQAKEIRDLRRRLRESRLILPPRTYEAVKSSFANDDDDEPDGDDDGDGSEDIEGVEDAGFERVKHLVDALIQSGKCALESKPEEFRNNSAKVLNADEVRSWRDSERFIASITTKSDDIHEEDRDGQTTRSRLSPAFVRASGSDCEYSLESVDVDGCSLHPMNTMSPLPPITITPS